MKILPCITLALIAAGLLEDARDTVNRMITLMEKAMG
jgi:hypothetical protein